METEDSKVAPLPTSNIQASDTAGAEKLATELNKTLNWTVQKYWLPTIGQPSPWNAKTFVTFSAACSAKQKSRTRESRRESPRIRRPNFSDC